MRITYARPDKAAAIQAKHFPHLTAKQIEAKSILTAAKGQRYYIAEGNHAGHYCYIYSEGSTHYCLGLSRGERGLGYTLRANTFYRDTGGLLNRIKRGEYRKA